ncbi:helix-turn-helix transcriptional regulator [Plantactinospora sp. KLBMP9567]|uniref:helix-turn-helix domain-containing protein n=1 Tax=Plantactinospora sp. KLBMP9567 TaxID=3085900 RepID=UPI002981E7EE|nr:helix-turn-helix transcriptional regulator [Plantactinospora sp. KLBMP9567]MDW5328640.1 helix-turn-helix transcriptional regulator [Plantactinospora sp. KLBMP9567]
MANPKDLPRDIGGFIRDLRRNAKISLRQLAEQAGVSNPYLSQIERGLRKPSAEVLQQLASALRVSTPAMYLRAGLLDDREGQGVLAAIAADPDLTMPQKQSLSQIYETFRRENLRHADVPAEPAATGVPVVAADEDPAEAVLESVAVTEAGAAAPPAAPPTESRPGTEPTPPAAATKRTARKAVKKAAPSTPTVVSASDEEEKS